MDPPVPASPGLPVQQKWLLGGVTLRSVTLIELRGSLAPNP